MTTPERDKALQMLKDARLYCTEARIAILQVLMLAARPLRQDQIADQLTLHALNKVTVYRTLESLIEVGLVHRAFTYKRAWYFELADHCTENQCHPHFTCTHCGVTTCLTDILLPMAKVAQKGFVVNRQQVRLEGLCPTCA
jgi:Fur family transcriptional regulator, ferric uptake regulator